MEDASLDAATLAGATQPLSFSVRHAAMDAALTWAGVPGANSLTLVHHVFEYTGAVQQLKYTK